MQRQSEGYNPRAELDRDPELAGLLHDIASASEPVDLAALAAGVEHAWQVLMSEPDETRPPSVDRPEARSPEIAEQALHALAGPVRTHALETFQRFVQNKLDRAEAARLALQFARDWEKSRGLHEPPPDASPSLQRLRGR